MFTKVLGCFLGLMIAGLAASAVALAQPASAPNRGFQERFREIKRTQLVSFLGVNQQTVDRLLQIEAAYKSRRQQLIRESKDDFRRLQQVISKPAPSEQEVKAILSEIKRKKREMEALQTRQGEDEEALLTPVQQARYIMYLKSLLQEARSVKGRGQGETVPMIPGGPREIPVINRPGR